MRFHHAQRGVAFGVPLRDEVLFGFQLFLGGIGKPEMHHRDIGLMAVLLEKHPLQRLGTVPGIAGPKRR